MYNVKNLISTQADYKQHGWLPARPVDLFSLKRRLRDAWYIFTGKALAITWPKDL